MSSNWNEQKLADELLCDLYAISKPKDIAEFEQSSSATRAAFAMLRSAHYSEFSRTPMTALWSEYFAAEARRLPIAFKTDELDDESLAAVNELVSVIQHARRTADGTEYTSLSEDQQVAWSILQYAGKKTIDPEELAQHFHESYERLAPTFDYRTRDRSAVPWADVPDNNKRLMIATCTEILDTVVLQWIHAAVDGVAGG